ncbi:MULTISPECIES: hypothetical protein [unclassified Crossiella]|uniref:hypothetical protein n=1 Tax=unclassified Crossiella TaxID=2620835 RepID=UPI001FFE8C12|nr:MULTISPECIES: hypothetical protein [unclassified Crossiella]MCK2236481.1 hypothetical protein [Crossiella sp. S99.2]MCK2250148.1 hypothetical protein [Crossiella sp. S99.1]
MLMIIGILLVGWIALSVIGFLVKGLFWLAIVGGVIFVGATAVTWVKKQNRQIH